LKLLRFFEIGEVLGSRAILESLFALIQVVIPYHANSAEVLT